MRSFFLRLHSLRFDLMDKVPPVESLELLHLFEWAWDDRAVVVQHALSKLPEHLRLWRLGRVLQHCPAFHLAGLDNRTARDEADQAAAQPLGKLGQHALLELLFAGAVADHAGQPNLAALGQAVDALGDVVGGVKAHEGAGAQQVDLLGKAGADGLGEAAAHHVAQDVVDDHVHTVGVKRLEVLEDLQGRQHSPPGAADAWLRPAGLDAMHAAMPGEDDILQGDGALIAPHPHQVAQRLQHRGDHPSPGQRAG